MKFQQGAGRYQIPGHIIEEAMDRYKGIEKSPRRQPRYRRYIYIPKTERDRMGKLPERKNQ